MTGSRVRQLRKQVDRHNPKALASHRRKAIGTGVPAERTADSSEEKRGGIFKRLKKAG